MGHHVVAFLSGELEGCVIYRQPIDIVPLVQEKLGQFKVFMEGCVLKEGHHPLGILRHVSRSAKLLNKEMYHFGSALICRHHEMLS